MKNKKLDETPTPRLVRNVPDEIWAQLKSICALEQVSIGEKISQMIRDAVKK